MRLAWELGGGAGLIALKMIVIGSTTAIAWQLLRRAGVPLVGRDVLLLVLVFAIWPRTAVVRPQLFSVLLFAALMWSIQSSDRGKGRRLFFVPLIFMAWINLHGGWIVGFGMFGGWLALTLLSGKPPLPVPMLLGIAASCTAVLLVNPHGWQMLRFVAETVRCRSQRHHRLDPDLALRRSAGAVGCLDGGGRWHCRASLASHSDR